MTRTLALDIEAVPTTDPPEFRKSDTWRPFAIALSHRSVPQATPDTAVLVRRDGTDYARRKLLTAMANWIGAHAPHDTLVTYNGGCFSDGPPEADTADPFDLGILAHHIGEIAADDPALATYLHSALNIDHRDLFAEIRERQSDDEKWPSLSECLDERSIPVTTATLGDRVVDGGVMPTLGERVLASDDALSDEERDALKRYAKSDVVPLHDLRDALDRERQAEQEAAAVTDGGGSDGE